MYKNVIGVINWIFIGMLCLSIISLSTKIFYHIYARHPAYKFKRAKIKHKYAILVPARNESKVIDNLLKSLSAQSYPKELYDIYVIVESTDDPTCNICKSYKNVEVFVRPNLDVKTKGGALDQAIKYIQQEKSDKKYEAYFIFDADNVVKENFIYEMNKCFDEGYDMALSYRNSSNWNNGRIASCSALTFSMINTCTNKARARFLHTVLVSGTGFYIRASIIDNLHGWPFQTLTEDAELSNFAVLNNLKSTYNENTEFYDEQPESFKQSWTQRVRWCKGHIQVCSKYQNKIFKSFFTTKENKLAKLEFGLSVIPVAILIASVLIYAICMMVLGFVGLAMQQSDFYWCFLYFALVLLATYVVLCLYSWYLVSLEKKKINLSRKNKLITILYNPLFLCQYLPIYITAIFKKNVKWKVIEHNNTNTSTIVKK